MMKRLAVLVLVISSMPRGAAAQDTQYWNLQYGTKGELLSGMVVGSALDMSSTFYNPGALAWVEDPKFILTASVFGMQTIKVTDEDPDQEAVTSRTFGPLPNMFAGVLPMKWFGGRTAYSFLTRQKFDFRMETREGVVIGRDVPGDTLSVGGEIILNESMSDSWGGFSWAKKAGEHMAFGATLYGVYRGQYTRQQQTVEAIGGAGFGASMIIANEVDFWDARVLAKLGAYSDLGPTTLGIAFTTPSAHLFGSGELLQNQSLTGDTDGDGISDSRAQVGFGEGLDTEYKSPLSVALGGSHKFKKMTVHATIEYFAAIDEYTVVTSPALTAGPGVTGVEVRYANAAKDVFNWGIGVEQGFSETGIFFASFTSDASAYEEVDGRQIVVSTWDLYHLNGGVALTIGNADLTLGGGFSWGQRELDPPTLPGTPTLPPTVIPSAVGYTQMKFIVGFAL